MSPLICPLSKDNATSDPLSEDDASGAARHVDDQTEQLTSVLGASHAKWSSVVRLRRVDSLRAEAVHGRRPCAMYGTPSKQMRITGEGTVEESIG